MRRAMTSPESRCSALHDAALVRGWIHARGPGRHRPGHVPTMSRRMSERSVVVSNSFGGGIGGKYPGGFAVTSGDIVPSVGAAVPQAGRTAHTRTTEKRCVSIGRSL